MAIFHLSTKPIKRSSGRSATASAAYRAACEIEDKRTGLTHDYSKKSGVVNSEAFVVVDGEKVAVDRAQLWNAAEFAEKRKDARTAREIVINLPHELSKELRQNLVEDFTEYVAQKYNVAIDYAIHEPDKHGDNRNHHAHILMTTRDVTLKNGSVELGKKTSLELSNTKLKTLDMPKTQEQIVSLRQSWATMTNDYLSFANVDARIDHRSFEERGLSIQPTIKLGWEASALERSGIATDRGDFNRAIRADNVQIVNLENEIVDLRQALKQSEIQLPKPSPFSHKKRADKIPDVEIGSFAKNMLTGLHKEHDAILEQSNDAVFDERFDNSYQQFFHNVDSFYNLMLKECDKQSQRDKSFADVVESVSAVVELVKNIEDVRVEKDIELSPSAADAQQSFVESHEALASKVEQQTQQQTQQHTRRL